MLEEDDHLNFALQDQGQLNVELYDNCKIDHTTKEQLHKLIDNCVAEIDCCINNPFLQRKSVESMKGKLAADLIVTMFQLLATSKKNTVSDFCTGFFH